MRPTPRILHVEAGRHLYGGALQVVYLTRALARAGYDNALACAPDSAIASAAGAQRLYPTTIRGDLDPGLVIRLARTIRREAPDIVHVHSRRGDLFAALAAALARTPAVLTRRVDNREHLPAKYRLFRHVITISKAISTVVLSQGVPAGRLSCVPSAVTLPEPVSAPERERLRDRLDLRADELACAVIAQLIPRKGHRFLIEAIPVILQRCPQARFLFFGQGPLDPALRSQCRVLGVEAQVRFAGFRDDLPQLLPALDLVIHPALQEGLGVSLLQASAAQLPIVAARAGGIPEIVRDGVNGLLVEPGNATALAAAVRTLLRDGARRRALGVRGREIVARDFSVARMVQGNMAVYRKVLEG